MKIGDIIKKDGLCYKVTDIIEYSFGTYPNTILVGSDVKAVNEPVKAIEEPIKEVVDYESMGIKDLQTICKEKGLPIRGTKAEVIERLKGAE